MKPRPLIHRAAEAVRRSRELSAEAKIVILEFYSFADPDGTNIRPAVPTVAKNLGISDRSVQRGVRHAVKHGYLIDVTPEDVRSTQAETHTANSYRAPDPGDSNVTSLVTDRVLTLVTVLSPNL